MLLLQAAEWRRRCEGAQGGKGGAGPGEEGGAAEQQDGVCLTTVGRELRGGGKLAAASGQKGGVSRPADEPESPALSRR